MAPFYARYVPPEDAKNLISVTDGAQAAAPKKRKHEDEPKETADEQERRKSKKSKTKTNKDESIQSSKHQRKEKTSSKKSKDNLQKVSEKSRDLQAQDSAEKEFRPGEQVLAKYNVTKASKNIRTPIAPAFNETDGHVKDMKHLSGPEANSQSLVRKKKSKEFSERPVLSSTMTEASDMKSHFPDPLHEDSKYARIQSKFEKAKLRSAQLERMAKEAGSEDSSTEGFSKNAEGIPEAELHGLHPLPQPPEIKYPEAKPTYSTLPPWLAKPLQVSGLEKSKFKDLKINESLVSNLVAKGLEDAFPVQSVVIPLLLAGSQRYHGDLCISAATGSGKTLAYVLPMIEALRSLAVTKLRGLVIVPTRELVKQAREVCEICAAGTSLKIATALGSKSLKEEQETLIKKFQVYNPERFQRARSRAVDWASFSLQDAFHEADEGDEDLEGYVTEYASNVDILICTPGRLVDHLRSTPGFTLGDVQWLVIDEADRLLNESFQEWVELVVPALESQESEKMRNQILRHMRLEVPERTIQRVILSATLTQDISKLNSLGLRNPKLIVIGEKLEAESIKESGIELSNSERLPDASGAFSLPPTLTESVFAIADESAKPLYLLELLRTHVFRSPTRPQAKIRSSTPDPDSSESSESESSESSDESASSATSSLSEESPQAITKNKSGSGEDHKGPKNNTALLFTRSTESATRLARLLSLLDPNLSNTIGTLTKSTTSSSARKARSQFLQGKLSLLIATDLASRGLDLPDLAHVISYDVPTSAITYVHRVGRTARAGKPGHAWTLLAHREARWFWKEIGKGGAAGEGELKISRNGKVGRVNVEAGLITSVERQRKYEEALKILGEEAKGITGR